MTKHAIMTGTVVFASAVILALQGCAGVPKKSEIDTIAANQMHQLMDAVPKVPASAEGSLWRPGTPMLYVDARARSVGDTLTVDIMQTSTSTMAANTTTARTSSIDGSVDNALGAMRSLEASNKNLGVDSKGTQSDTLLKADLTDSHKGTGSIDRSGSISASIGARVVEVYPNGNLVIFGKQEMKVNNETQYIIVSGVVRPEDIDASNTVQSTSLADAHIEYVGRGVIADKQRTGWGTRLIDMIWPF